MIEITEKKFSLNNKTKEQLIEEIKEFVNSLYMDENDSLEIKKLMKERNINRIVFRDKENKLLPLRYGELNIIGVLISKKGIVWLVDDSKIKSDISGDIRENCYKDKHYLLSFAKDFKNALIDYIIKC